MSDLQSRGHAASAVRPVQLPAIDYNKYFVRDHLRMEHNTVNAVCASAYSAASFLNADAIVAVTRSGRTAKILSDFKPTCPVIAVTRHLRSRRARVLRHRLEHLRRGNDNFARLIALIDHHLLQRRNLAERYFHAEIVPLCAARTM